jgi:hypothetical protein
MLSGEVLADALAAGDPESFPARWRVGPGREFAWAARHARAFFEPRSIERLVGLCARSPAAARVLSDVMAGLQAYRTLTLRLLASGPAIALDLALRPSRGSSGTDR